MFDHEISTRETSITECLISQQVYKQNFEVSPDILI
jgi:hypothetical protein